MTTAEHVDDSFPSQFVSWLSTLAIGTTVCLFLTGLEICWRIRSQRTTNGISSTPFHTGFLSGQLWLQYGLLRHNEIIICVNSVAALLYSLYIFYYFIMAPYATKNRCVRLIFAEVMFLMGAHYYIHYYGLPVEMIRLHLGMCCVIFNVVTAAAPLEALREVFRTRCTETMPLPLCCLTLLVAAEWLLYGILIDDIYIQVPNAIASVIAVVQLLPFLYFPRNKQIAIITTS
ncbi:Sugar efflux transporter for intercellular exchange family protein [Acanthocheilonema viteae]